MMAGGSIEKANIWHDERHERKCVLAAADYDLLTSWIDRQEMAFRRTYPQRVVQSLYFDSHSLDDFGDTLSGVGDRKKVRLRWYGGDCRVRQAVLEVKCKRNMLGVKLSYPMDLPAPLSSINLELLVKLIAQRLPEEVRAGVEYANQAVALVEYKREYFASWDQRVRITLDRDLRVYDQLDSGHINDARVSPLPELAVLELKYAAEIDHEVRASLEALPHRLSRFSKYSIGVQRLLGV
jgi:SPX domain protein involved in polyphosphate accumulation